MWRFYIRHQTAMFSTMSDASRANWSACHQVYRSAPPDWHAILSTYYGSSRQSRDGNVKSFCFDHAITTTDFFRIIHAAQAQAAACRGLIDGNRESPSLRGDKDSKAIK